MARVKTFRIHPSYGIPDLEIEEFISRCEKKNIVNVETLFIPAYGVTPYGAAADPRIIIIVTKLDEHEMEKWTIEEQADKQIVNDHVAKEFNE